jgi:hypothetical protein
MTADEEKRLRTLANSTVLGSDMRAIITDVERLRLENQALVSELDQLRAQARLREDVHHLLALRFEKVDSDRLKLQAFAVEIFEGWPEAGSLDGGDLQRYGAKHGLLVPTQVIASV